MESSLGVDLAYIFNPYVPDALEPFKHGYTAMRVFCSLFCFFDLPPNVLSKALSIFVEFVLLKPGKMKLNKA